MLLTRSFEVKFMRTFKDVLSSASKIEADPSSNALDKRLFVAAVRVRYLSLTVDSVSLVSQTAVHKI